MVKYLLKKERSMHKETQDDGFLLKLLQLEKLIKQYKTPLIIAIVAVIVAVVGYNINSYLQTQKLIQTNQAYDKLLKDPNDIKALEVLKQNKPLFRLYLLQTAGDDVAKLQQVANAKGVVANIAKYQLAMLKGDKKAVEDYALSMDIMYKDLALLNLVKIYLRNHNHTKAVQITKQIKDDTIHKIAQSLLHYGIVK